MRIQRKACVYLGVIVCTCFWALGTAFAQGVGGGGAGGIPGLGSPLATSQPGQAFPPRAAIFSRDPFQAINFALCEMGGVDGSLTQVLAGGASKLSGGASGYGKCGEVIQINDTSCEAFFVSENQFDESLLKKTLQKAKASEEAASCKIRESEVKAANAAKAAKVAGCFKTQFDNLKSAMEEVKKDFDYNIEQMKQYTSQVQAAAEEEHKKQETLGGKIQNLEGVQKVVIELLAQVGGVSPPGTDEQARTISQLEKRMIEHSSLVKQYRLRIENEKVWRTSACISGVGSRRSTLRGCATPSGQPLAPKECLLAIYRDSTALQRSGGSISISPVDRQRAQEATNYFQQRIEHILRELANPNPRFTSMDSFLSFYKNDFAHFGNAGLQFKAEIRNCYNDSKEGVQADLRNPGSELGATDEGLKKAAITISSEAGAMIKPMQETLRLVGNEVYEQDFNALALRPGCSNEVSASNASALEFQNVRLGSQLQCAKELREYLSSLSDGRPLPGSNAATQVPLHVPETAPDGTPTNQPARCYGIGGCLAKAKKLLQASSQRQQSLMGDSYFNDPRCSGGRCPGIKKFTKDSNIAIQSAFQKAADAFQSRVAVAKMQLDRVKTLLGQAGIFPEINDSQKTSFKCEQKDEEGLCQMPDPFGNALASAAGLPMLEGAAFTSIQREADAKTKEYEAETKTISAEAQQVSDSILRLQKAKTVCAKKAKDEKKKEKEVKVTRLASRVATLYSECAELSENGNPPSGIDEKFENLRIELKRLCENKDFDLDGCIELEERLGPSSAHRCEAIATNKARSQQPIIIQSGPAPASGGAK